MSGEHVSRPEFDMFMKTTADASKQTAEAITKLTEYTIHNDHKHIEVDRRLSNQGKTIYKLKEAVEANTRVTQIAKPIKWIALIIITGALMAYGSHLTTDYYKEDAKVK